MERRLARNHRTDQANYSSSRGPSLQVGGDYTSGVRIFPKLDNVPVISSHGSKMRAGGCLVVMLTASGLPPKDCQLFRREIQEIRDALQVFQTGG
jgi:hypothetical protein